MNKAISMIVAALALAACGQSARLGSLGRNDTVVTNLAPAYAYTDAVAAEFESGTLSVRFANYAQNAEEAVQAGGVMNESGSVSLNANALIRESTNAAIAVAARKQDALPYPTNAIPYAAISGAPSGAPEWRQEVIYASMEPVFFVTNGWMDVGVDDDIYVRTAGWPSGAAMFVRCHVTSDYAVMPPIRLVGYGTWPTNDFQSVWWRSGTNIFVNFLIEE